MLIMKILRLDVKTNTQGSSLRVSLGLEDYRPAGLVDPLGQPLFKKRLSIASMFVPLKMRSVLALGDPVQVVLRGFSSTFVDSAGQTYTNFEGSLFAMGGGLIAESVAQPDEPTAIESENASAAESGSFTPPPATKGKGKKGKKSESAEGEEAEDFGL